MTATLVGDKKADKIKVFKYRPKSGYRRTQGHRQLMTVLEVDEIALSPDQKVTREDVKAKDEVEAGEKEPAAKKPAAKKPAAKKPASKKASAKKPAGQKPS